MEGTKGVVGGIERRSYRIGNVKTQRLGKKTKTTRIDSPTHTHTRCVSAVKVGRLPKKIEFSGSSPVEELGPEVD